MNTLKGLTAAAGLALAISAVPANAAIITKTLTLTGNFTSSSLPSSALVKFSLNFDNSASFVQSTSAVTLISTNLFGPLEISYDAVHDTLALVGGIATSGLNSCTPNWGSFCSFIGHVSSSQPTSLTLLAYSTTLDSEQATNIEIVVDGRGGAVPEPATWAMMLAGFGMIGFAARRRRQSVKTTVAYA